METSYTTQLMLSMLFFAPGIILFAGLAFVGVLMVVEKTFFHRQSGLHLATPAGNVDLAHAMNPAPGAIVGGLKQATSGQSDSARTNDRSSGKS